MCGKSTVNSKKYIQKMSVDSSKCNFISAADHCIRNNMESVRKISASDSKCNFGISNKNRIIPPVILPTFGLQKSDIVRKYKRPNSFPSSSSSDNFTSTGRTKSLSLLISQFETVINDSKNTDNSQISNRMHRINAKNFILPLSNDAINKNDVPIPTDFKSQAFSETKRDLRESAIFHREEGNTATIYVNKNTDSFETHNFVNTSIDKESPINNNSHIITSESKKLNVRIVPEHLYEEIDEIDSHSMMQYSECNDTNTSTSASKATSQKLNEDKILPENEELVRVVNQRWQGNQERFGSLDRDKSEVDAKDYNVENDEDEIWKNYTERPLLPLKPLQKRSISCVNLVQTIKGLSKKKTSSNSRHSSPINSIKTFLFPENALTHKKEIYTSEANISEINSELDAPADLTVRRVNDTDIIGKHTRQSLLPNYTWFHPVDAKEASKRLLKMQQNGAFLIRPASNPTSEVLHTLCVVFSGKVYNFHVKCLKDGRITLGKRKGQEEAFSSLLDMIKYHQTVPISIHSSESNEVSHVYLLITPPK